MSLHNASVVARKLRGRLEPTGGAFVNRELRWLVPFWLTPKVFGDSTTVRPFLRVVSVLVGFEIAIGTSFHVYVERARMRRAAEILRESDCAVKDAARSVGYTSMSTFGRAFKRQFGASPKDFRFAANR
jgi:hypothetical protein